MFVLFILEIHWYFLYDVVDFISSSCLEEWGKVKVKASQFLSSQRRTLFEIGAAGAAGVTIRHH